MTDRDEAARDQGLRPLLRELRERFRDAADLRAVRVYLAARGYDGPRLDEVLAAFQAPHLADDAESAAAAPIASAPPARPAPAALPPLRVAAPHERARFEPDAWAWLLQHRATAGWSVAELEHVIERALVQIDGRIAVDDLRTLLDGAFGGPAESPTVH
ncbi:hypothetical protein [Roseisolibacter sp. H3M3-2]|uniref:hypothetical protein n=1 Tax=Roseisolibacter sp. H3M3-2 TaxID=3031323 RepID=UPI0023D9C131|nr:hypothetical protein [Roseisolibacter sp. H3M3-2]MDF1503959.1 hypothetical protein [Roseisolibacter sp. H3M3-2]